MKRTRMIWPRRPPRCPLPHFAGPIAVALAAALAVAPAQAAGQEAAYDLSGLDLFWQTADILAEGRDPSDAEWRRLLAHPGYVQIERSGGRGAAVRECLPLVFRPGRGAELGTALEEGNMRVKRVCGHLQRIRDQRAELESLRAELGASDELARGIERARAVLPEGATEGEPPAVYVILFEENGFGGASLALDLGLLSQMAESDRLGYLAHEFHHAFGSRVSELEVDSDDADYLLVAALTSLAEEGIASLLDKREYIAEDYRPSSERFAGLVGEFKDAYARSNDVLAQVDEHLQQLARGDGTPADVGPQIKSLLPWGGHPTGMFMALAIERAEGPARLGELSTNALDFILSYQAVAEAEGGYKFSDTSIALVRELRDAHTAR